jgi:hypothetical protein
MIHHRTTLAGLPAALALVFGAFAFYATPASAQVAHCTGIPGIPCYQDIQAPIPAKWSDPTYYEYISVTACQSLDYHTTAGWVYYGPRPAPLNYTLDQNTPHITLVAHCKFIPESCFISGVGC